VEAEAATAGRFGRRRESERRAKAEQRQAEDWLQIHIVLLDTASMVKSGPIHARPLLTESS
jgi:hypothetical protein